jgi:hypothetical protein
MNVPLHIIVFQSFGDAFMPLQHFRVWLRGECIAWDIFGEGLALCIDYIPHSHHVVEKAPVLVRVHE